MFARRQRTAPPATPAVLATVHAQLVPVADPDTSAITRERALRQRLGSMMQGHNNGTVVDYDRGDPVHSFERIVPHVNLPAQAYAQLGMRDQAIIGQPQIYDMGSTDEELTAYQAAMLARIARPK
jgi:hypothetical protein